MKKTELYFQVADSYRQEQDSRNREFDGKATGIIGLSATLVGIGILVVRFSGQSALSIPEWIVAIAMVGCFLATAVCCLSIIRPRIWHRNPKLSDLAKHLEKHEGDVLVKWVGDQYHKAVERNEAILSKKADLLAWALGLLALSTILLAFLAALLYSAI